MMTDHAAARPRTDFVKVGLWMGASLLSFCAIAVAIRALAPQFSIFEILAFRNIGGLVILGAMAALARKPEMRLRPSSVRLHLLRNSVHFVGQALWAYGVIVLPLAVVFAVEFTTPVWVAIFAALFLGERLTRARLAAIALGFIGVVIVLRPGLDQFDPNALLVLAAALFFGLQLVVTKKLTGADSTWTILFWMNLMQLPLNIAANVALGGPVWFLDKAPGHELAILAIAVAGFLAHFCLTNAFRHGDAVLVAPIDFLRVPLIALIGWAFYAEGLDPFVFAGAAVIIAGVLISLRAEARR